MIPQTHTLLQQKPAEHLKSFKGDSRHIFFFRIQGSNSGLLSNILMSGEELLDFYLEKFRRTFKQKQGKCCCVFWGGFCEPSLSFPAACRLSDGGSCFSNTTSSLHLCSLSYYLFFWGFAQQVNNKGRRLAKTLAVLRSEGFLEFSRYKIPTVFPRRWIPVTFLASWSEQRNSSSREQDAPSWPKITLDSPWSLLTLCDDVDQMSRAATSCWGCYQSVCTLSVKYQKKAKKAAPLIQ